MRIFVRFSLVLLALSLAACAPDLAKLQTAEFQPYEPDLSGAVEPATIRGSYIENADILGKTSRAVGVFALDGKTAFKGGFETPIPLTPGIHSLTIGYLNSGYGDTIPVMLDAKPGARYVVKRSKDKDWLDGLKYDRIRTWLYIEEEKTGEIVLRPTPDVLRSIEGRYQPPSNLDAGTISGSGTGSLANSISVYPIAVDGQIVEEDKGKDRLPGVLWTPTKPVIVAPGVRAIALSATGGMGIRYLPILLDVKPNTSYVAKVEHRLKKHGALRIFTYTIWIEDGVTGEIVLPRTDLPGEPYPML